MQQGHTMSIRTRWLNFIMHLTAAIAERKQDLTKFHAIRTFFDVLKIMLLEGVLAIVTIPLYLTMKTETLSPHNEFNVEYSIRKTLTYALFFLFILVLILKAGLIAGQIGSQKQVLSPINAGPEASQQIHGFLTAKVDKMMDSPVLSTIDIPGSASFNAHGTAVPGTTVVLYVSRRASTSASDFTQMYSVRAAADGTWTIASSPGFHPEAGTYLFQVQGYDEAHHLKSVFGPSQEQIFQPSTGEVLLGTLNWAANVLVISFIAIGFIVVFLTF